MSISGLSFGFWRIIEIITLIPALGMLAYFVNAYTKLNSLTPDSILVLFIVVVLATAWAVATLVLYAQARHSAHFVAFVDLLFVGALIGGVVELRGIASANCTHFTSNSFFFDLGVLAVSGNGWSVNVRKNCAMLKASFAFGIMNIIFFATTFVRHAPGNRPDLVVNAASSYSPCLSTAIMSMIALSSAAALTTRAGVTATIRAARVAPTTAAAGAATMLSRRKSDIRGKARGFLGKI